MENEKTARSAVKISLISLFVFLIFGLILISITLTQINATAALDKKVKVLEEKIEKMQNNQASR
ncbi:DUF5408 family protein [Helicobacter pametensis]|uniref:DUF5408 family protein n=1 Tax=Helicobacter pametensis TaxID=95149 RepID=UPI0004862300|nr:DUF5408 family protein [Helicobacter pametensis]